jgi:hypothetical protein
MSAGRKKRSRKCSKPTCVVKSTRLCCSLRNRLSTENARTVTMPSSSSLKLENIGERVLASIRRRSRPVLRYPRAISKYTNPIKAAGTRNQGKMTLKKDSMTFWFTFNQIWHSRNRYDGNEEHGQRGIHAFQRLHKLGVNRLNVFREPVQHAT